MSVFEGGIKDRKRPSRYKRSYLDLTNLATLANLANLTNLATSRHARKLKFGTDTH